MSKPKSFSKQDKAPKHKQKNPPPETADEYQAAGVEAEESGGKHRAGDGAKSMRFFDRAIEIYEAGLRKFPDSFDLAYNKARVQYEIATHPVLVKQAQLPVLQMLETALASHRYALQLAPDNADTLFNTAGVLTSIAEEIAQDGNIPDTQALALLEEALEQQNTCLAVQEFMFAENQEQQRAMMEVQSQSPDPDSAPDTVTSPQSMDAVSDHSEEKWASIVEPVTKETLLDTIEAQLSTLTTLCSILHSSPGSAPPSMLALVEEYSSQLLNVKVPAYLEGTSGRLEGLALAKANFLSALLEAGFRSGSLDAQTYKRERDAAFAVPELDTTSSPASLLSNATSLIAFSSALAEIMLVDVAPLASMRWAALAAAIVDLTKAAKLDNMPTEDLPKTHVLRGDASILQYQLSKPSVAYQAAVSNAAALVKNAEVFYRNAYRLSNDVSERNEAMLKESLAVLIQDKEQGLAKIQALADAQGFQWIAAQVDDIMQERLYDDGDVAALPLPPLQIIGLGSKS